MGRWWLKMKKPFPLFIDMEVTPPLVIGNANILLAKVRLLLKFGPVVEVITDSDTLAFAEIGQGVRQAQNVSCAVAHDHIRGRPLVMVETLDDQLNTSLVARARHFGVPVNVPDNPALSSVYLGSIVDRAPLTVAISSSGMAPVLGQNLRARIEDMLPSNYGNLAVYLHQVRQRLRGLPASWRRRLQHQIIDGPIADDIIAGRTARADAEVLPLLRAFAIEKSDRRRISIVQTLHRKDSADCTDTLSAIRDADTIFYDDNVPASFLEVARREVDLIALPQKFGNRRTSAGLAAALLRATIGGKSVVYLGSHGVARLNLALLKLGFSSASLITSDDSERIEGHLTLCERPDATLPERVQ